VGYFTLPRGGFLKKPQHVAVICVFIINRMHQLKYTGLFLWQCVSCWE